MGDPKQRWTVGNMKWESAELVRDGIQIVAHFVGNKASDYALKLAHQGNNFDALLEAAKDAQCDCSIRERDSGHKTECWMPALIAAIAAAEEKQ